MKVPSFASIEAFVIKLLALVLLLIAAAKLVAFELSSFLVH